MTLHKPKARSMFETLDQIEEDIRKSLAEAASNRRSPMHTPVVGTVDADVRMMVLRGWDARTATLRLHTDARSAKVRQIGEGARVGLLFHDPDARIQIRAKGQGHILTQGEQVESAWAASSEYARRCYLAVAAPGSASDGPTSGLPAEVEGVRPSEEQLLPARENFALLMVEVDAFDWLLLAHDGHRRAQFVRAGAGWQGMWVVP
ncbi:pyridoxamine 5'-phosphate oxidase family protein [Altererythrobacter lauratis]